ncbi:MAG TPA: hypothetical protein EYP25_13060 [Anaerolineae bacterium]|nr:hypothetical protein [Caldilineae bacterium]HID35470.1 hypothetical protein [Anaerolineae bacterium]
MNHRPALLIWLFFSGVCITGMVRLVAPSHALAAPFLSPTPAPNTLNQPFVTFQKVSVSPHWLRFDSGVPVGVTILILMLLLGLVSIYLHSFRSRH